MSKLTDLYEKCPDIKCPEGCHDCCSPIPLIREEMEILGKTKLRTEWKDNFDCEFLTPEGCSIYDKRPFACRQFGCAEEGDYSCAKVIGGEFLSALVAQQMVVDYAMLGISQGYEIDEEVAMAALRHDQIKWSQGLIQKKIK